MATTAQNYYPQITAMELAKQQEFRRSLTRTQIEHKKKLKQEKKKYSQQLTSGVKSSRYVAPQTDAQKKQNIRKIQKATQGIVKDEELQNIADDASSIFTSSRVMLPTNITRLAIDSRAALKDYTSKWWIVAFILACAKDGIIDVDIFVISYLVGWPLTLYFIIFLFGGGFVKKKLKKKIVFMIFLIVVSFIPVVNVFFPEVVVAVVLRWSGSKKAAEKGEKNLKRIQEKYAGYDT